MNHVIDFIEMAAVIVMIWVLLFFGLIGIAKWQEQWHDVNMPYYEYQTLEDGDVITGRVMDI